MFKIFPLVVLLGLFSQAVLAGPYPLVETVEDLRLPCQKMKQAKHIAVDLEFDRNILCLIQVCWGEGEKDGVLVDYCALHKAKPRAAKHALGPLLSVFDTPKLTKVFHAPAQDLRILYNLMGRLPKSVVDTQAMYAAIKPTFTAGYAQVVEDMLGATVDKEMQTSSWTERPLSAAQCLYASGDVSHLYKLYPLLCEELDKLKRTAFMRGYFAAKFTISGSIQEGRKKLTQLISQARKRGVHQIHRLKALAHWRKQQAPHFGTKIFRDLSDMNLIEVSSSDETLKQKKYGPYRSVLSSFLASHPVKAISEGSVQDGASPAKNQFMGYLMDALQERAQFLNMAQQMLATKAELKKALKNRSSSLLEGESARLLGYKLRFLICQYHENPWYTTNWVALLSEE